MLPGKKKASYCICRRAHKVGLYRKTIKEKNKKGENGASSFSLNASKLDGNPKDSYFTELKKRQTLILQL